MLTPTIRPVHNWRNKKNKNGLYPIHLEIKINGSRKYYPLPVPQNVAAKDWSGKDDAWVKPGHPFAFEINNKIREKKAIVHDLIKRYYSITQSLTFETIFRALKKSGNANIFNDFFDDYIKHPTDKLEPDTFKKYRAYFDHLKNFNSTIRFHDLTPDLIEELEDSLFEDLHIEVKKSKRTYLTIEEIKEWKNCTFSDDKELWVRLGAQRTIISKMLGHSKEQTTNIYFRVNLPEVV